MIDISLLNTIQMDAIEELRKRVENVMPSDLFDDRIYIYKFLKARDFNLDKAERMIRRNIQFRKHFQISNMVENFKRKEFFVKFVEPGTIGLDKDGDIVTYVPIGHIDGRDALKCVTINDFRKHWLWFCEKFHTVTKQQREKEGMRSQQLCIIFDLNGLTFANTTSKLSAQILVRLTQDLQYNYPESVKRIYLINAPPFYVFILALLRPFMSAATVEKIHFKGGWKEMLLDAIDADVLPSFMGGKRTDPDGDTLCRTFIGCGGWMPQNLYLTDEDRDFKDKSQVMKIYVPFSSKKDIYFDVAEEESVIQWEFLIKDKDIRFGLFFKGSDDVVEILPLQKYDTMDGVEKGSYKSKFSGKYFITFDNSYSWYNSKVIEFCITVLKKEV